MADETQLTVWVEGAIKAQMDAVKRDKGTPISAQVRFAVLEWLEREGYPVKLAPAAEGGAL